LQFCVGIFPKYFSDSLNAAQLLAVTSQTDTKTKLDLAIVKIF